LFSDNVVTLCCSDDKSAGGSRNTKYISHLVEAGGIIKMIESIMIWMVLQDEEETEEENLD